MKNKTILLLIVMTGIFFAGCIEDKEEIIKNETSETIKTVKYVENYDTILKKDDIPGFKLIDHKYFISPDNLTLTLKIESYHGSQMIDANKSAIPTGFRLYGGSELYQGENISKKSNITNKHILMQYKVFDNGEDLNQSINDTAYLYAENGYRNVILNGTNYTERIFILEKSVNNSDSSIIIILLGYDTILGKIGVQDSKNATLNKSLNMLDILLERLKVGSKNMAINKTKIISEMADFNITQKIAPIDEY